LLYVLSVQFFDIRLPQLLLLPMATLLLLLAFAEGGDGNSEAHKKMRENRKLTTVTRASRVTNVPVVMAGPVNGQITLLTP
jgi:hypothetical protein